MKLLFFISFILLISKGQSYGQDTLAINNDTPEIVFKSLELTPSSSVIHWKWEVESEQNGKTFLLEKSTDGETWKEVSKVKSIGNHSELKVYQHSAMNFIQSSTEHFRISRISSSGSIQVLDSTTKNNPVLSKIQFIPTPGKVMEGGTLAYESLKDMDVYVSIVNEEGKVKYEKKMFATKGYNRVPLYLKKVPEGRYRIIVKDSKENKISKGFKIYGSSKKKKKKR